MYVRTVKVRSSSGKVNEYVRIVESYRQEGKVKQRVVADLGRKDLLEELLPQLQRVLRGLPQVEGESDPVEILQAASWGPTLAVRALFEELGLWEMLDELMGPSRSDVSYADRAFVLIANRLIRPKSEHALAWWLETDFVCDRRGRRFVPRWRRRGRVRVHHQQLDAWYRTLDRLLAAKEELEVRLYRRLRDLFSLQPDLVLYDITSTYFEGAGPPELARHGYSRDGKPQNVQAIVGLVMVGGWPIAHHVWQGNRVDSTTVDEAVQDLTQRFSFGRIVFVGDRGMVSEDNLAALEAQGHGYLVGLKRRRNPQLDAWLQTLKEDKWEDCPVGINAQESKHPPRTRVQEVGLDEESAQRVFVIDSEERRAYEQGKREQAMERTRVKLESVQRRVAEGTLTSPAQIGAAAERALRAHRGYRYYDWRLREGRFEFFEHPVYLPREKRLEGRYVVATSEKDFTAQDAVAMYKELMEVERSFRSLKDVLAMRPIYHRDDRRVRAHIFVAALALLLRRLLQRRLQEAGVDLSPEVALETLRTVHHVAVRVANGKTRPGVSQASPQARRVLKALGLQNLRPPAPPPDQSTIM